MKYVVYVLAALILASCVGTKSAPKKFISSTFVEVSGERLLVVEKVPGLRLEYWDAVSDKTQYYGDGTWKGEVIEVSADLGPSGSNMMMLPVARPAIFSFDAPGFEKATFGVAIAPEIRTPSTRLPRLGPNGTRWGAAGWNFNEVTKKLLKRLNYDCAGCPDTGSLPQLFVFRTVATCTGYVNGSLYSSLTCTNQDSSDE